jgi:AraC-like DNA-binding protein
MPLDNLEYLTIKKQVTDFPNHYHETFCISLIHKGIEVINLNGQNFYSETGSITITNPYEIHSNPLIDSASQLSFDTLYISKDLMKYLLNGKNIAFINRKITNQKANELFIKLKKAIDFNDNQKVELLLFKFIEILKYYSQEKNEAYTDLNFNTLNQINDYIENNINSKFCLEELAKIANINKFGFAKKFKASTGMSPMNYILMKKIFSSKKNICKNSELTQIAFDYDFSDMAHFSKTFKRYVGLSPKIYKDNLKKINS